MRLIEIKKIIVIKIILFTNAKFQLHKKPNIVPILCIIYVKLSLIRIMKKIIYIIFTHPYDIINKNIYIINKHVISQITSHFRK